MPSSNIKRYVSAWQTAYQAKADLHVFEFM